MISSIKKAAFLILIFLVCQTGMQAQKFGYVDSKYILSHIPAYQQAQDEINQLSQEWQQEIEQKYETIEKLEKAFQAEKILMTEEMKKKREAEIDTKRKEARELQQKRFGIEGDLFKKREELIQPIQDQIYDAIQEVSSQGGLMVVFDKANQSNILYSNPKHDISDKVLKKMGLKPGDVQGGEEGGDEKDQEETPKTTSPGNGKSGGKTNGKTSPARTGGKKP